MEGTGSVETSAATAKYGVTPEARIMKCACCFFLFLRHHAHCVVGISGTHCYKNYIPEFPLNTCARFGGEGEEVLKPTSCMCSIVNVRVKYVKGHKSPHNGETGLRHALSQK